MEAGNGRRFFGGDSQAHLHAEAQAQNEMHADLGAHADVGGHGASHQMEDVQEMHGREAFGRNRVHHRDDGRHDNRAGDRHDNRLGDRHDDGHGDRHDDGHGNNHANGRIFELSNNKEAWWNNDDWWNDWRAGTQPGSIHAPHPGAFSQNLENPRQPSPPQRPQSAARRPQGASRRLQAASRHPNGKNLETDQKTRPPKITEEMVLKVGKLPSWWKHPDSPYK